MRSALWLMAGTLMFGTACSDGPTFNPLDDTPDDTDDTGEPPLDVTTLSIELEYTRADVSFLVDTTGSMSGLANALADEFSGIAASLSAEFPESSFGVGMYRDYNHGGMGSGDDKPYHLLQQQTTDLSLVQGGLDSLIITGGADWPESSIEAVFQAASGKGYDQNCNGAFDSQDDVRPFIEAGTDVFGGSVTGFYQEGVEGSGELGGMGYRLGAVPVIIYGTDAALRDVENHGTPPGACFAATREMAAGAIKDINGVLIGVNVSYGPDNTVTSEMSGLASLVGSQFLDGTPAVIEWSNGDDPAELLSKVTEAVNEATASLEFDSIAVVVLEDPGNVLVRVIPDVLENVSRGEIHDFEITVRGAVAVEGAPGAVPLTLAVATPDGTYLSIKTVWVIPPGDAGAE